MQTFLPYPSFTRTAESLDYRRLGKQRVEAYQIILSLTLPDYGWRHHPAVQMWKGYELALAVYFNCMVEEWERRGYRNTMTRMLDGETDQREFDLPPWLGKRRFHESHQSNLLRKDSAFYRPLFPSVPDNLPYFWPTKETP